MELSREPAVMDRELSAPEPPGAVDKTAFLTALTVLGVGMSFLVAMMFVLFPEWVRPRAFATETSTPPGRIFTLRAPHNSCSSSEGFIWIAHDRNSSAGASAGAGSPVAAPASGRASALRKFLSITLKFQSREP